MTSSAPSKVRLAVVGCGAVTSIHHLPAIAASRRAEAVLLVDSDRRRAEALARRYGVSEVATDARAVVGKAEGAIVALPNHLHAPVSIDLLSRGVHVLVEKPMAMSVAEADAMIQAAATWSSRLAVGLEFRHFPGALFVRNLLRDGLLGPIRRFDLRQGVVPRWPFATDFLLRKEMAGGGVLADFGVHVLDLLLWWLGEWAEVDYRDDAAGGIESDCEMELTMRSGCRGAVEVSRTRNLRNTCLLEGERATLEVGVWDPDPRIRLTVGDREVALEGRGRRAEGGAAIGDQAPTMAGAFVRQVDDFAAAIRDGREPYVTGAEGRRSLALIEACYARRRPLVFPWSIAPREVPRPAVESEAELPPAQPNAGVA
jgi:predicted dehydrogenase